MAITRWLYNSDGDPIAFVQGDNVYSKQGDFVGKLFADNTIWFGEYVGELFADDRLIFDTRKLHGNRPMPGMNALPAFTGDPGFKGPAIIPLGFRDVEFR